MGFTKYFRKKYPYIDTETESETDLFCFQVFVRVFSSSVIKKKIICSLPKIIIKIYVSGKITKQNTFSIIICAITILGEQSTTKCT